MSANRAPRGSQQNEEPGLGPTRIRDLAAIAVIAGVATYVLVRYNYGSLPPMPLLAGIVLYILAVLEVIIGFIVRSRVDSREVGRARGQLHPISAARVLALAKASSILAAISVGVWTGLLLFLWGEHGVTAAANDRPGAIIGLVGGVLLAVAALWLEYCCRTPDDPPEGPLDPYPGSA